MIRELSHYAWTSQGPRVPKRRTSVFGAMMAANSQRQLRCRKLDFSTRSSDINPSDQSSDGVECSMCGDVGFQEELFRCQNCFERVQHRYCSRSYLKLSTESKWVCDWCLDVADEEKSRKQFVKFKARKAKLDAPLSCTDSACNQPSTGTEGGISYPTCSPRGNDSEQVATKKRRLCNGPKESSWKCFRESSNSQVAASRSPFARRYKRLQDVLCAS